MKEKCLNSFLAGSNLSKDNNAKLISIVMRLFSERYDNTLTVLMCSLYSLYSLGYTYKAVLTAVLYILHEADTAGKA